MDTCNNCLNAYNTHEGGVRCYNLDWIYQDTPEFDTECYINPQDSCSCYQLRRHDQKKLVFTRQLSLFD